MKDAIFRLLHNLYTPISKKVVRATGHRTGIGHIKTECNMDLKMYLNSCFLGQIATKYESRITNIHLFRYCPCLALFDCV
jgi:hypothetical protein